MIRTSLLIASCCLALLRQPICGGYEGPCEYEDTPLDADYVTESGKTLGEEVAALEGSYSGTWRWYASEPELTIEGGGVELPALATFVADPSSYREVDLARPSAGVACLDTGIKVDGVLTFTDEQGGVITSMEITVDRNDGSVPSYFASLDFSPITEFSNRLHANVDYDTSYVAGHIHFRDEDQLEATFTFGGQSVIGTTDIGTEIGAGVIIEVAAFE